MSVNRVGIDKFSKKSGSNFLSIRRRVANNIRTGYFSNKRRNASFKISRSIPTTLPIDKQEEEENCRESRNTTEPSKDNNSGVRGRGSNNMSKQACFMILLPFIPIFALVLQNLLSLKAVLEYQTEIQDISRQVKVAGDVAKLISQLQWERSELAFFIFLNGTTVRSNLTTRFSKTDSTLMKVQYWPKNAKDPAFETKFIFLARLHDFRRQITENGTHMYQVIEYYTSSNRVLLKYLTNEIKETKNSDVWRYLLSYKNLLRSVENFGISVVYGINYFGRGNLTRPNHIEFTRHDTLGHEYLNISMDLILAEHQFGEIFERLDNLSYNIENLRTQILVNELQVPDMEESVYYFESMATLLETLRWAQKRLRFHVDNTVGESIANVNIKVWTATAILILVLCVSPLIIYLTHKAMSTIKIFANHLLENAHELSREKLKSDRLLQQMLPPSVLTELKQKRQAPATYFDQVSIYFSDIVGFTQIAASSTPLEVVSFLNSVYRLFDSRIEKYDVYKVETVGDGYLVASGLPILNGNRHAWEIATMALDLVGCTPVLKIPRRPNESMEIRVGIHCGPVMAGVVGSKMPRYCLFGDTVNTASRMETTGLPQKIHMSCEMKVALDEIGGFQIEHRGLIDVKGKGLLDTFWLIGKIGNSTEIAVHPYQYDAVIDQIEYLDEDLYEDHK